MHQKREIYYLQHSPLPQARHIYICDFHKGRIQCARTKRRRRDSEDDSNETDTDLPEVDLYQLQVNTLRRYKRFYKVSTRPGINKAQLSEVRKRGKSKFCNIAIDFNFCFHSDHHEAL